LSFGIIINKIIYHVGAFKKRLILISTFNIHLFFLLWTKLAFGLFNSPFAGSQPLF